MARSTDPGRMLVDRICAGEAVAQTWLVALDAEGAVGRTLANLGHAPRTWQRHATAGAATPEPPAGPFSGVALRLPRGREALRLAAELCAARTVPGGRIWAYGPNDEGARSAGRHLAEWYDEIRTVDTRGHGRLWTGVRGAAPARGALADHAVSRTLPLPSGPRTFVSYPGAFARGELDPGTELLLQHLPASEPRTVLDFACGIGVIAAACCERWSGVRVHGLDADALAVHAARDNVPGAEFACGAGWSGLADLPRPNGGYDLVLSNPPIHSGRDLDLSTMADLVTRAPQYLAARGTLLIVTQRQRPPTGGGLAAVPGRLIAEDHRFRVWAWTGRAPTTRGR